MRVSLKDGRRVSISIRSIEQEPGQLILLSDLTETRELQSQLSRYERLSAMGRMVASGSPDSNTVVYRDAVRRSPGAVAYGR